MKRARGTAAGCGSGEDPTRGRTRWWLFAGLVSLATLVLLPVLVVLVGVLLSESDDRADGREPDQVPCSEALGFGGAALPDGARPVGACTHQAFLDTHYGAAFRMPRTGVREWLAHTYPEAPAPAGTYCPDGADLCLDLSYGQGLPDGVEAHVVQVRVVHEDAGTALVRFASFTL
ncbi:hypothetical protein [Streptomyces lienomycini]|uniref:Uncharacterized protein n=1 Tax=Streptomyces lienomycini TaxID=284035 RepID=A0ABV9WVI6_9ACTN|nr:hypothetical protein [Streptomyces lienomycini]